MNLCCHSFFMRHIYRSERTFHRITYVRNCFKKMLIFKLRFPSRRVICNRMKAKVRKKILCQSATLNQPLNFPFSTFVHCRSMYQQNSMMCRVRPFSVNSVDLSLVDKTIPPFRSNPARPLDYFDVNSPPASKYYFCPSIYSMGFCSS